MQISYDAIIRPPEEWRLPVLVDHHDVLGSLASDQVLNGTADSTGDVQVRCDAIPRKTDLVRMRPPPVIGGHARPPDRTPEKAGEFFQHLEAIRTADSTPSSHYDRSRSEVDSFRTGFFSGSDPDTDVGPLIDGQSI